MILEKLDSKGKLYTIECNLKEKIDISIIIILAIFSVLSFFFVLNIIFN